MLPMLPLVDTAAFAATAVATAAAMNMYYVPKHPTVDTFGTSYACRRPFLAGCVLRVCSVFIVELVVHFMRCAPSSQ